MDGNEEKDEKIQRKMDSFQAYHLSLNGKRLVLKFLLPHWKVSLLSFNGDRREDHFCHVHSV
jgi:hypothetical protein